ncbi:AzlC family ABC transporter permease [Acetivibrio clariflavus]|uniref:Putative branched-chain amino acid permease (Azaleucine resistance) n=1 Tax=Acetivibrio clariflavus (strain DSM 19732 / NBRC 101661 / EBR45) TaxID=720554 RepID=G8LWY9_ACECE|nr:AzlC family ABC transporter permease [Acetivibrio clariflavus]AEV67641.1 putative branched-chain amino acid permease (azaleucine resistance) [Acetivibrio clariflavus DSM 19732]
MNTYLPCKKEFVYGFKKGFPIALGYVPVSFTFGLMAVNGGISPLMAVFISLTNLTSAGQFAGTNLIINNAGLFEITMTTFVINIRYILMSLSLSQKIKPDTSLTQRLIFGFGITDETFSIASMEEGKLSYSYMIGLILGPIIGWSLGTALGAFTCSALPDSISRAMGIALYAMFIAIIVPPAKKSRPILMIIVISIAINILLKYIPLFSFISSGFRTIISTIMAAGIGAFLWPLEENKEE